MLIVNVDDDRDDRELFTRALKTVDPSITCMLFERGEDALAFLEKTQILPDFIFVDINMPRLDGYQFVREVRRQEKFKKLRIIMHSTAFNPYEMDEARELDLKFLIKPSKLSDLIQSIRDLVS